MKKTYYYNGKKIRTSSLEKTYKYAVIRSKGDWWICDGMSVTRENAEKLMRVAVNSPYSCYRGQGYDFKVVEVEVIEK